jgi:hypothetical protein
VKKYWAGALAAACCAVGSGAALASVFVTVSENGVVAAGWGQSHQPIEALGHQLGHYADSPIGANSPSLTQPGAFSGPAAAKLVRPGSDRRVSGADATNAIRLPEPATWAMMFVGLSMIGLATRRRRNFDIP